MGQQQLLLLVLAVIVVGAAVLWGIGLFRGNAIESKRDLLVTESSSLATLALAYYKKPSEFNGGGNSFLGWKIPTPMRKTEAGSYNEIVTEDQITIIGTGTEVVTGTDSIKIQTVVVDSGYYTYIIN